MSTLLWKLRRTLVLFFIGNLLLANHLQSQEARLFRIQGWGGTLGFRFQKQKRWMPLLVRQNEFQEKMSLQNRGFIITPRLFRFKWSGDLALLQEKVVDPILPRASKSRFINQSLIAMVLPQSANPFTLVISRSASTIDLDFAGHNTYDNKNFQATLDLPGFYISSRIVAMQRDIKDEWSRANFTTRRDERRRKFKFSGNRDGETTNIKISYDYFGLKNRFFPKQSYSSQSGRFHLRHVFGQNNHHQSETSFIFIIRSGLFDYKDAKITQSLEYQHFPWLTSRIRYAFSVRRSIYATSLQNSASETLNYILYKSLKASLGFGGVFVSSKQGGYKNRSVKAGINYSKRIPLSGLFQIGYSRSYALTNRESQSIEQQIVNERHVVIGGLPFMLNERNVILSSIQLFDEESKTFFEQGEDKDYFIRRVGNFVEIQMNPLGRIRENVILLVNYRFQTLPSMRYSTNTRLFNASLAFGPLTFYHYENNHDIDVITGTYQAKLALGNLYTRTTGVRFGFRKWRTGFSLLAEQKIQDSNFLAYKSLNIRNALQINLRYNFAVSSNFEYYAINHTREVRRIIIRSLRTSVRWRPTTNLILQGFGKIKIRQETHQSEENIFEYGARLLRQWPIMKLKLSYEHRKWELYPRIIDDRRFLLEIERRL